MLCIVRWKSSTQTICCSNCYFPKSGGGLDLVRTKRSRPSVKRGWDTGSSHHCKRKTRRPWAALASAGGLPSNNMAQLHASVLLSLPKQWHGPHNQPRISSALFWCHCCDKTTHRWRFFFFFTSFLGCLTPHWAQIQRATPFVISMSCHTKFDLVLITLFP